MPITEKEYLDALREADQRHDGEMRLAAQRAIDLLAATNSARFNGVVAAMMTVVSIASLLVAIWAVAARTGKC